MTTSIHQIRLDYEQLQKYIYDNKMSKITPKVANDQYVKVTQQMSKNQRENNFNDIQQLLFYKQQYEKLRHHFDQAQKGTFTNSKQKSNQDIRNIFAKNYQPKEKMSNNLIASLANMAVSHKKVNSFFDQKEAELKKGQKKVTFKDVLQSSVPHRNFRKKPTKNQSIIKNQDPNIKRQIQDIKRQNQALKDYINRRQTNPNNEQEIRQIQRVKQRILYLQNQASNLESINQSLRQNINSKQNMVNNNGLINDNQSQGPYSVITRNNNIKLIDDDNFARSTYNMKSDQYLNNRDEKKSYQIQEENNYRFNDSNRYTRNLVQKSNQDSYLKLNLEGNSKINNKKSNIDSKRSHNSNFDQKQIKKISQGPNRQSLQNGNYFGSYIKPSDVYYSPADQYTGIYNQQTCSRNKVAFFKQSLIIVKDQNYQIAFRSSGLSSDLTEQSFVFFVRNKTKNQISVSLDYKNYGGDYRIYIDKKLSRVPSYQQQKQIIKIQLCNYDKLESVIDLQVLIKDEFGNVKVYQLWVPACFIKFDYKYRGQQQFGINNSRSKGLSSSRQRSIYQKVKIEPDEQFKSYYHAVQAGLPLSNKSQNTYNSQTSAWLYGQSKHYSGGVKLTWQQGKRRLMIQGSQKWVDLIGFVLHKYKGKK